MILRGREGPKVGEAKRRPAVLLQDLQPSQLKKTRRFDNVLQLPSILLAGFTETRRRCANKRPEVSALYLGQTLVRASCGLRQICFALNSTLMTSTSQSNLDILQASPTHLARALLVTHVFVSSSFNQFVNS